jgi:hypothetical protein
MPPANGNDAHDPCRVVFGVKFRCAMTAVALLALAWQLLLVLIRLARLAASDQPK